MTPYYDEDGITIYHADCRDVLPTIDPMSVNLVLTDPPYGIRIVDNNGHIGIGRRSPSPSHLPIAGDDKPFDPSPLLLFGRCVLWGANHYADKLPPSGGWIVWDKDLGLNQNNFSDCELAWSNLSAGVRCFRHLWKGVLRDSEIGWHVHPTQKPVSLMRWILERWTQPGDLILDPYMGSGPVGKAALDLGRRYVGIEIEERYCEIAVQRLAQGVLEFK